MKVVKVQAVHPVYGQGTLYHTAFVNIVDTGIETHPVLNDLSYR